MADEAGASQTLPNSSSHTQNNEKPLPRTLAEWQVSGLVALKSSYPTKSRAIELATKLIGAWAKSEADDPHLYLLSIASALREYPTLIGEQCADPRIGLARTREFLPTVASVHAWCLDRIKVFESIKDVM